MQFMILYEKSKVKYKAYYDFTLYVPGDDLVTYAYFNEVQYIENSSKKTFSIDASGSYDP